MEARKRKAEFEKLIECPVCYQSLRPPVYQCTHGHAICAKCTKIIREKAKENHVSAKCPTCVEPYPIQKDIRALVFEQSLRISTQTVNCKFKDCKVAKVWSEIIEHEKSCVKGFGFQCFMCDTDEESIKPEEYVKHLLTTHQEMTGGKRQNLQAKKGVYTEQFLMGFQKFKFEPSQRMWKWVSVYGLQKRPGHEKPPVFVLCITVSSSAKVPESEWKVSIWGKFVSRTEEVRKYRVSIRMSTPEEYIHEDDLGCTFAVSGLGSGFDTAIEGPDHVRLMVPYNIFKKMAGPDMLSVPVQFEITGGTEE